MNTTASSNPTYVELVEGLTQAHGAMQRLVGRLVDAGLYGTPDDLQGGVNQQALWTARVLLLWAQETREEEN